MSDSCDPSMSDARENRIAEMVRQNTASAAIGAACLLFFGFFHFTRPTGTDLFSLANLIFFYVLRVGGVLMALIALASWAGLRVALIVDAVASVAIGALFVVTAAMMLIDGGGGFNAFLIIIFGIMFASAGFRNGRAFFALAPQNADRMRTKSVAPPPYSSQAGPQPDENLAGRLLTTRQSGGAVGGEVSPRSTPPALRGVQADEDFSAGGSNAELAVSRVTGNIDVPIDDAGDPDPENDAELDAKAVDVSPPPGGFLASFAPRATERKQP